MRAALGVVLLLCACDLADSALVGARCDATHGCGAGALVCDLTTQRCALPGDAGSDAGAGLDAGPDAGTDAGADAGADSGVDAGTDAGFDAGPLPTTIATGARVTGLVVEENEVLWTTSAPDGGIEDGGSDPNGGIWRLALPPAPIPQLLRRVAFGAKLEVRGEALVWLTPSGLNVALRDGGYAFPNLGELLFDFDIDPPDAGSQAFIWYTQPALGQIGKRTLSGGSPLVNNPVCLPRYVAAAPPQGAFIATDCTLDPSGTTLDGGQLLFFDRPGGDPIPYAQELSPPVAIAASANHVYWATNTTVARVSRALQVDGGPGPVQSITAAGVRVCGLALDDRAIFWTDQATGSVHRRALDLSSGAVTIASGQAGPCAIGVNATRVLWVNTGDGAIQSLPR